MRPDLDGNAIMELLGIGPGREVGRGLDDSSRTCASSAVRSTREDAEAELLAWWAAPELSGSRCRSAPTVPK